MARNDPPTAQNFNFAVRGDEDLANGLKGRYRAGDDDHAGVRSETSDTHAAAVIWLREIVTQQSIQLQPTVKMEGSSTRRA